MAYKTKPGFGALFKNKHKQQDNHPNARGDVCCPGCEKTWEIASWTKETRDGDKFQSLKLSEPREQSRDEPRDEPPPSDPDDANPF